MSMSTTAYIAVAMSVSEYMKLTDWKYDDENGYYQGEYKDDGWGDWHLDCIIPHYQCEIFIGYDDSDEDEKHIMWILECADGVGSADKIDLLTLHNKSQRVIDELEKCEPSTKGKWQVKLLLERI